MHQPWVTPTKEAAEPLQNGYLRAAEGHVGHRPDQLCLDPRNSGFFVGLEVTE